MKYVTTVLLMFISYMSVILEHTLSFFLFALERKYIETNINVMGLFQNAFNMLFNIAYIQSPESSTCPILLVLDFLHIL